MATNSKNYNLIKPSVDDNYNVDDFNHNSDIIDTELANKLNKADTDTMKADVLHNKEYYNSHKVTEINSEQGIHNLRCFDDKVEFHDGNSWVQIYTGGRGLHPQNVTSKAIKVGNGQATITWGDPENTYVGSELVCAWEGTKLVYKAGSYPLNPNDGIVAVDNTVRNKYKTNGFTITKLTNGVTYYFALFPYSNRGAVNLNTVNRLTGQPVSYRTMTVIIDNNNSNPDTRCTYADDAAGITPQSKELEEFFGYYPCMLKDDTEGGRLNHMNLAQYTDGTAADITSGDSGNVMMKYPRRGYRWIAGTDTDRISITDDPNAEGYIYEAFIDEDKINAAEFFLGVYPVKGISAEGAIDEMVSLSGYTYQYLSESYFFTNVNNLPKYYGSINVHHWFYIMCMYAIYCCSTNPSCITGDNSFLDEYYLSRGITTGRDNKKGYFNGYTAKLFGLEGIYTERGTYCDKVKSRRFYLSEGYVQIEDSRGGYYREDVAFGYTTKALGGKYFCFPEKEGASTSTYYKSLSVSGNIDFNVFKRMALGTRTYMFGFVANNLPTGKDTRFGRISYCKGG